MNWYDRFSKDQKGVFIVFTAILLPIIFACAGLAMDLGNAFAHRSKLQNAADAAALAGAHVFYTDQNSVRANAEAYQQVNYKGKKIDNIEIWGLNGDTSNGILLTVDASDEIETTFMKLLGFNTVPISVKATCKVTPVKTSSKSAFDYAFIAGSTSKVNSSQPWADWAMKFDANKARIKGAVHANGAIFISDNVNSNSERYVLVEPGKFSTSIKNDDELWANRRDGVGQDEHDKGTSQIPAILHKNDLELPSQWGKSYRYYSRIGYDDGGKTPWGDDVVASAAPGNELKIDMTKDNPMTSDIYQYVEKMRQAGNSDEVYINTDGNYSAADNLYSGWDKGYGDWKPHKVVICDGDIGIYPNHVTDDVIPMIIISLHGNVQISTLNRNNGFKALIYAPHGTVTYNYQGSTKEACQFEGSIVANRIYANSNEMTYTWNNFKFGPNGIGSGSGSSESSGETSGTGSIVLYPENYTGYNHMMNL